MLEKIKPYAKAVVAFFLPGILMVGTILANEGRWPNQSEWLMALGLSVVTSLGVYLTPNKPLALQ